MTDPMYKDPKQPIEARVDDLLGRMTLEEKVGQMLQLDGRVEAEKELKRATFAVV